LRKIRPRLKSYSKPFTQRFPLSRAKIVRVINKLLYAHFSQKQPRVFYQISLDLDNLSIFAKLVRLDAITRIGEKKFAPRET